MRHIATFCGQCNCGCPELHLDDPAAPEKRVVLTDDPLMAAHRLELPFGFDPRTIPAP